MDENQIKAMIQEATKMLGFSYAPYSNYKVGACLLASTGELFTGCNIENIAFGPSNCAERTAFFKAVSEGKTKFTAIAIVGGQNGLLQDFCTPCGVCRQVMREFCDDDFVIISAKSPDNYKTFSLAEILPHSFKPEGQVGKAAD